jgi:hypothetical protein
LDMSHYYGKRRPPVKHGEHRCSFTAPAEGCQVITSRSGPHDDLRLVAYARDVGDWARWLARRLWCSARDRTVLQNHDAVGGFR